MQADSLKSTWPVSCWQWGFQKLPCIHVTQKTNVWNSLLCMVLVLIISSCLLSRRFSSFLLPVLSSPLPDYTRPSFNRKWVDKFLVISKQCCCLKHKSGVRHRILQGMKCVLTISGSVSSWKKSQVKLPGKWNWRLSRAWNKKRIYNVT